MFNPASITPFEATHPGELIKDELEFHEDLTQKDLALLLGVKPSFLNEIIKGKRPITADTAILLEKALGIDAQYWMDFQSQYELDKAKIQEKNQHKIKLMDLWDTIKKYVPVKTLIQKKYLGEDLEKNIHHIKEIYQVNSIDNLAHLFSKRKFAFYKRSKNLKINEKNLIAWTVLAEYEAAQKKVQPFNAEEVYQIAQYLQQIFFKNKNTFAQIDHLLARYGIKFIHIEKLKKTPIDGYSFWLKNNPVIAVSIRHKRIDNLAFTIMHELGHINLHLKHNKEQRFIDNITQIQENEIEREANQFAEEILMPQEVWSDYMQDNHKTRDQKIKAISKKHQINPAIIHGQICFQRNNYRVKSQIDRSIQ